jgi:hypothetical protein
MHRPFSIPQKTVGAARAAHAPLGAGERAPRRLAHASHPLFSALAGKVALNP